MKKGILFEKKTTMKKTFIVLFFTLSIVLAKAQVTVTKDTAGDGTVTIFKDPRLDILAKKEASFNETYTMGPRSARGYRLMVLSTNDRPLAMNVRSKLLQRYPDQKVYMSFQPPNIKLRFGNFVEKEDADRYKKEILKSKLVSNNIYLLPEIIEVKPDKDKDKDSSN